MDNKDLTRVGVIGTGSFGTAVASLLAENTRVLFYSRRKEVTDEMLATGMHMGKNLHPNVLPTNDLNEVCNNCQLIFPIIPSVNFREMMKNLAPGLSKDHILIHGTKGLDLTGHVSEKIENIERKDVHTMTEVIREESDVTLCGCLAGPNLASEIMDGQIAATVIASDHDEVIEAGIEVLRTPVFQAYGSHDLIGAEWTGILKNPIAIASGMLSGMGMGENGRAYLITKGLGEMIRLGSKLGSDKSAFLGLAGVGDLIATCSSKLSRNYSVGFRVGQGEKLDEIIASMTEVAEGLNTLKIILGLSKSLNIRMPILLTLYKILYENLTPEKGVELLMSHPYNVDVDFM